MDINIITLWDDNCQRLMEIEKNLRVVMRKMNIHATVQLNSELPLLKRSGVHGKTPILQINDGKFWTYRVDETIPVEAFQSIFDCLNSYHKS